MSHKATVKLKIENKNDLLQALDHMGIKHKEAKTENDITINSRYGVKANVDIQLVKDAQNTNIKDVGFKKNEDGSYSAIGDFWDLRSAKTKDGESLSESKFKKAISKRYAYVQAVNKFTESGFLISEDVEDFKNDEISLTVETV